MKKKKKERNPCQILHSIVHDHLDAFINTEISLRYKRDKCHIILILYRELKAKKKPQQLVTGLLV